jgi:GT2 family glycosyltransferase
MTQPFVHIIILNWKRPEDTVACLASLGQISYNNYGILLVDNYSNDESVEKITAWLKSSGYTFTEHAVVDSENIVAQTTPKNVQLILNNENSGFAKGNNIGIKAALKAGSDFVLLLNNDTEVEKDFLDKLIEQKTKMPEMAAVTPQIRLYEPKDVLWNCGGKLILGGFWKKYYYSYQHKKFIDDNRIVKPISFITGCALLYDPKELGLLTEDFFFGEEDFEFSLRLRKMNKKMGCVMDSLIYHKVGTSLDDVNTVGKRYIHILNRLVNTRRNNFTVFWPFLALGIVFHNFMALLRKEKMGLFSAIKFSTSLFRNGINLNKVDQTMFLNILYKKEW